MTTESKSTQSIITNSSVVVDDDLDVSDDVSENNILIEPEYVKRFEIVSVEKSYEEYFTKKRKTLPYINKYEKAKIFGIRAQQLANGSIPLVPTDDKINIREIVEEEYRKKKIPLIIRRYLPDNTHEDWRVIDFLNI